MNVNLLPNMHQANDVDLPNWVAIQTLMPSTHHNLDLLEYDQSHGTTKTKVTFTDYHYHILNQFYIPNVTKRQTDTDSWVRAEFHSIVMSLYSSLDSLAYEVNLAYNFGLKPYQIHIYHNHTSIVSDCFRCNMNIQNDNLTSFFNSELGKDWFQIFNRLRNQIVHKNLPVIQIVIGGYATSIKIPNDPANTNPQANDYSNNLEINNYCKELRQNVVRIIEGAYPHISPIVKQRYDL